MVLVTVFVATAYSSILYKTFSAPLNYKYPQQGNLTLNVAIIPVKSQKNKLGTLVINFGEPWDQQINNLKSLHTEHPLLYSRLHQKFDLVSFNPRGSRGQIGSCNSPEANKLFGDMIKLDLTSAQSEMLYLQDQRSFLNICYPQYKGNKLFRYSGTNNSVLDLDLLRQSLHLKKINYMGVSYGTALGIQYLMKFPQHVNKMILDGSLPPEYNMLPSARDRAIVAKRILHLFFKLCDKSTYCSLNKDPMQKVFTRVLIKSNAGEGIPSKGLESLNSGMLLNLMGPIFSEASPKQDLSILGFGHLTTWQYLALGLHQADKGDATMLVKLFNLVFSYNANTGMSIMNKDSEIDIARNLQCVDFNKTPEYPNYLLDFSRKMTESYGHVAGMAASGIGTSSSFCYHWQDLVNNDPLKKINIKYGGNKLLIVGGRYDPNTPFVWSRMMYKAVPQSHLLKWNGIGHTAYYSGMSNCVINNEMKLLLDYKLPNKIICNENSNPFEG